MDKPQAERLHECIPPVMKAARRWVLYGNPNGKDEGRKIPYQLDGRNYASPTDSSTWGAFDDAVEAACKRGFKGLMFALGDGFSGVDFDGLVNPNSENKEAYRAIDELIGLIGSYTEYSPSGTGFHTITRADWPLNTDSLRRDSSKHKHCAVECYSGRRFFTVTGLVYDIYSDMTENHKGFHSFFVEIQRIFKDNHHKKKEFKSVAATYQRREDGFRPPDDDKELLRIISNSKQGAEFDRLFCGGYDEGDESRLDLTLMNILAFFTNGDAARMERLFKQSALYARPDFSKHGRDYIARTINKALS